VVRPQQSDRVLRLRELARQAADVDWPDEEKTNPVIVQVGMPMEPRPEQKSESKIEEGAQAVTGIVSAVKSWVQVTALGIIALAVVAVTVTYLLTH